MTTAALLILVSVTYWGIRLTANWAYTFGGLGIQDWRYTKYRNETGKLYPFVNFTGIHMMPTLIVYLCTLPAVFVTTSEVNANIGSMAGTAVCVGAATLQLFADVQMHKYRKSGKHGLIRTPAVGIVMYVFLYLKGFSFGLQIHADADVQGLVLVSERIVIGVLHIATGILAPLLYINILLNEFFIEILNHEIFTLQVDHWTLCALLINEDNGTDASTSLVLQRP